ncbi:MAG: hypothetical protein LCH41_03590 [Armatimonadetes bacterium]|nr:hypothetical protein [Armatimonadota bacterium]
MFPYRSFVSMIMQVVMIMILRQLCMRRSIAMLDLRMIVFSDMRVDGNGVTMVVMRRKNVSLHS